MPVYRDPGLLAFDAPLRIPEASPNGGYIAFPYSVEELFGVRGRVPVKVTFDDVPYRGSIIRMRSEHHLLMILNAIRRQLDKDEGEIVHVTVRLDTEERTIELPPDAQAALAAAPGARAGWDRLSYTHQREHATAIAGAKRPETRARRIDQLVQRLTAPP